MEKRGNEKIKASMYWFRMRHPDTLPSGRCYIYSAGDLGQKLYMNLSHRREDIRILGFFDSYQNTDVAGVPVIKFSEFNHETDDYDYFIVAHDRAWREIVYENTRNTLKPFYVALPECFNMASPVRQNIESYDAIASRGFIPSSFCLQLCSRCNSKCVMCPSQPAMKNAFMPDELVEKILNEIADISPGANVYLSTGYGEPLIRPDLEKIIEKVVDRELNPIVTTNGILLRKERAESLMRAGLKTLYISFSGYSPETYQKVYGNPHFHTITQNIQDACEVASELGDGYQVCHLGCIFAEDNQGYLRQAYKSYDLLQQLGLDKTSVNFGFPQNRGHLVRSAPLREDRQMHSILTTFPPLTQPCHALDSIGINADGDVDLCYCASNSSAGSLIGNIYENSLETLAKNVKRVDAFKAFRDMHHSDDSICKYCDAPYLF